MRALLILPFLVACNTMPERVEVPVPVACVKPEQVPERPALVLDRDMPKGDRGARVLAMRGYQDLAEPYISQLEAIAVECSRLP